MGSHRIAWKRAQETSTVLLLRNRSCASALTHWAMASKTRGRVANRPICMVVAWRNIPKAPR